MDKEQQKVNQIRELLGDIHEMQDKRERSRAIRGSVAYKVMEDRLGDKNKRGRKEAFRSKDGPFKTFAEQLEAIRNAADPAQKVDNRLYKVQEQRAAQGLSETIGSDGAFMLQQDFSNEILKKVWSEGEIISGVRRMPITVGNSIKIPYSDESSRVNGSRWGGLRHYWSPEAVELTKSAPKFGQLELQLRKMTVLCYLTSELMEDATAAANFVQEAAADEIMFGLEDSIINGTGAGQPLGITNSGAKVTVDKESGQTATTVNYQNVLNMWARMPGRLMKEAVWLCNQDVLPQFYQMSLTVGTGGSAVYMPGGGASSSPYSALMGRPVIPVEFCQTLGTEGDLILWAPSQYLWAEKGGIRSDLSIHVRFVYDENVYRFIMRCDGQPAWRKAVTPYKGSNSLSPIITLQARG